MFASKLAILDLDGILYKPAATDLDVSALWGWSNKNFATTLIYTNDVTYPCAERQIDCFSFGAYPAEHQIITPLDVAYDYVLPRVAVDSPYILGSHIQAEGRGRIYKKESNGADCILVGDMTGMSAIEIDRVLSDARSRLPIFLLNGNMSNDASGHCDVGDIALEALSRNKILAPLIGKPSWTGFQYLLTKAQCQRSEALFITDHFFNDAIGSLMGGLSTVVLNAKGYWTNAGDDIADEIRSFIRSPHRMKRSAWE